MIDAWRNGELSLHEFPVTREAPPAFSVGRPMPVTYRWHNPSRRTLTIHVREVVVALLERGRTRATAA